MIDDGVAIDYATVQRGTPVYSADEVELGKVKEILDNRAEHIFDGVVFETTDGDSLFADAPEVARTAERGVTLRLTAAEAAKLPPHEKAPGVYKPNMSQGRVGRFLGGGWRRK
jgi:hypothetical protein